MIRSLTDREKSLISQFAVKLGGVECTQLLNDLKDASVELISDNNSRILFQISGYKRPVYRGQHPYAVEGTMLDGDGTELSVLLYADENGHLLELEFIRWGDGNLINPIWSTLKLS